MKVYTVLKSVLISFLFVLYWLVTLWLHRSREFSKGLFRISENHKIFSHRNGDTLKFKGAQNPDTRLRVTAAGDLIFEKQILEHLQSRISKEVPDPDMAVEDACRELFEEIDNSLCGDIVYGNLETVLGRGLSTGTGKAGERRITLQKDIPERSVYEKDVYDEKLLPLLNNHPALAQALNHTGFTLVSTANNHSEDRLSNGIDETLDHLDSAGIAHAGTHRYSTITDGPTPVPYILLDISNIRIAFFSYTARQNPFFPDPGRPNPLSQVCRFNPAWRARNYYPEISTWIRHAKEESKADIVMLAAHWGMENTHSVTPKQRRWAHSLCNDGADIILGHHPHALQPAEKYTRPDGSECLVLYSMGNFVAGIEKDIHLESGIFYIDIEKGGSGTAISGYSYLPTWTEHRHGSGNNIRVLPLDRLDSYENRIEGIRLLLGSNDIMSCHRGMP